MSTEPNTPDERTRPPEVPPLALTFNHFTGTMDALRELLDVASPEAETLDTNRLSPETLSALERLGPEKRALLVAWLADNREASEERIAPGSSDVESPIEPDVSASDPENNGAPIDRPEDPADPGSKRLSAEDQARLSEIFGDDLAAAMELVMTLFRSVTSPMRVDLLNGSILTMAVAAFEALLGGLAAEHYVRFPARLDATDKEFSLADLGRFETIDDARAAAVEDRVQSLMRRSLDDWAAWFDTQYKLDFRPFVDFDDLNEAFQRRHVLVHNGGRASRIYLSKVATPPDGVELGTRLLTDKEYVLHAIDMITAVGLLIGCTLWSRWEKAAAGYVQASFAEVTYKLMLAARWHAVRCICDGALDVYTALDLAGREVSRANLWLAHKRLGTFDSVRTQVEVWDTSALAPRFAFVKAALLDDLDAVFALVIPTFEKRDVSRGALAEWPVLEEMRADPRFSEILQQLPADPPDD